jgi:hypothetical protein
MSTIPLSQGKHGPVGAWLASEEAREIAKSFAGKPCSYKLCSVFNIPFS